MATESIDLTTKRSFDASLFGFLHELRENNDRDWFKANRHRYERSVQGPALEFIGDVAPALRTISPYLVADARPVGGSLFRIYRDTRFSRDKTPFKTHTALQFRHASGRDVHAPGLYLHLAPGDVFVAAGVWHPDTRTLGAIRDGIVAAPERWIAATREPPLAPSFQLFGETLKRAPAGYDADHPLVDDLKRKDFVAVTPLDDEVVILPGFLATFSEAARASAPLLRFLCEALELPF